MEGTRYLRRARSTAGGGLVNIYIYVFVKFDLYAQGKCTLCLAALSLSLSVRKKVQIQHQPVFLVPPPFLTLPTGTTASFSKMTKEDIHVLGQPIEFPNGLKAPNRFLKVSYQGEGFSSLLHVFAMNRG